jgi:hypothetical protein
VMVASAVARWLHAQGLGVYQPDGSGGDVFVDTLPSAPGEAIMVTSTGGMAVDGGQEWRWSTPSVQLLARGSTDPRSSSSRLSRVAAAIVTLAGTTWVDETGTLRIDGARAVQGEPVRVGPDEGGRHRHSLNLSLDVARG